MKNNFTKSQTRLTEEKKIILAAIIKNHEMLYYQYLSVGVRKEVCS